VCVCEISQNAILGSLLPGKKTILKYPLAFRCKHPPLRGYLAPEVIKQEEYGREIDLWSVGVILYVLLSGSLPFFHTVLHKLYRQIVERDLVFPSKSWTNVSKGAQNFILQTLQTRAGDRLTAEQARKHPWLRSTGSRPTSFVQAVGEYQIQDAENTYADFQDPRSQVDMNPLEVAHKSIRQQH